MAKKRKRVLAVRITANERKELERKTGRPLDEERDADVIAALRRAQVIEARDSTHQPNLTRGDK